MGGIQDTQVDVSADEVHAGCKASKKMYHLDVEGICIAALEPMGLQPAIAHLISCVVSTVEVMGQVTIKGSIRGKVCGTNTADQTRGLFPQPCLLEVASRVLLQKALPRLDAWFGQTA